MSGEYRGVVCHVLPTMVLQMFKEVNVIVLWSQYHNENKIDHLDISDFDSKSIQFTEIISLSFNDNSISGADPGFQVRGGRAHLKKLRRAEGGAKRFEVFRVKNHDFTPKK
jgi:hypothetical protein